MPKATGKAPCRSDSTSARDPASARARPLGDTSRECAPAVLDSFRRWLARTMSGEPIPPAAHSGPPGVRTDRRASEPPRDGSPPAATRLGRRHEEDLDEL